jgi:sulfur-oxidizing protein SoxB
MGQRISNMTLMRNGEAIDPKKSYVIAGWASVNEGTVGPPIWDVVSDYITDKKVIEVAPGAAVEIKGA